jgi:hypothetical protein
VSHPGWASYWRVGRRRAAVTVAGLILGVGCRATTASRADTPLASPRSIASGCFSVDAVSAEVAALADRLLLDAGDGEALYTLANGLKPLSSGRAVSVRVAPTLDQVALDSLELMRRATAVLSCGEIGAFVHTFTATSGTSGGDTRRAAEVVVFHRARVADVVRTHAAFFATLAITPSADVREVLAAVENAPRADRWRGYGLLFGYPDEAVDFFVRAGVEGDSMRAIVPRDFRRIETFRKFPAARDEPPTMSSFVYAVPQGAPESAADRALRDAAAPIYSRYARERARLIVGDSTGALALWRAWLRPQ